MITCVRPGYRSPSWCPRGPSPVTAALPARGPTCPPASAVRLLRDCDRLARVGVVVADLRRARSAEALFRLGGRLLRFDPVTLEDGVTSIRRGYTTGELRALLAEAGVAGRVARRPGYRLVGTWRVSPATDRP